jgi:hypothetical protein
MTNSNCSGTIYVREAIGEAMRQAREETLEKIRRELQECPGPEIE